MKKLSVTARHRAICLSESLINTDGSFAGARTIKTCCYFKYTERFSQDYKKFKLWSWDKKENAWTLRASVESIFWCYNYIVVIYLESYTHLAQAVRNNACLQHGKHPLLPTESTQGCPYMELKTTSGVIGSLTSKPEHVDLQRQFTWKHLLRHAYQRGHHSKKGLLQLCNSSHLITFTD